MNTIRLGIALLSLAGANSALGQRSLSEIPNPDPSYQQSMLKPAEGFEITLFASDPMIAKPVAMSFDARGRLFVATSATYPHIKPGAEPSDVIYRLEDTDGDGRADKRTLFADGLLIPSAILATPEGVYVGNSTELFLYQDHDDDGVADDREVVLSGFGTEDTHHIVHTLRAGPAGRIYFNQSIYIHSYLETPRGMKSLKAGGAWRLRPETMELDVYSYGLVNSWGLQFDKWGQTFQSDGAGSMGLSYAFPGAAFIRAEGFRRFMNGLNPGQPKHSGLEVISGRQFPEEWQGRMITCDFRGNRINSFEPSDAKSGFSLTQTEDLVTTTHGAFRPIDLQQGPDGALYVADWYNPIIQHGEVDFRDERRDHTHGRIWRIRAKDKPLLERPDLANASVSQLLDYLAVPEASTRLHAKMLLKHKGWSAVAAPLKRWVKGRHPSDENYDANLLEALWVTQSLDQTDEGLLGTLLASTDFRARAAAVRVLEEYPNKIQKIDTFLEKAVEDEHPRVRLEALHVLRALGGKESARLSMKAYRADRDDTFEYALWHSMNVLKDDWVPAAIENPEFFGEDPSHLMHAIGAIGEADALEPLLALWRKGKIEGDSKIEAMRLIAALGNEDALLMLWQELMSNEDEYGKRGIPIWNAMAKSGTSRKVYPKLTNANVEAVLALKDEVVKSAAIKLLGAWRVAESVGVLEKLILNKGTSSTLSDAAIQGLVTMRTGKAKAALLRLTGEEQAFSIRLTAISGYAKASPREVVKAAAAAFTMLKGEEDVNLLLRPYTGDARNAALLAKELAGKTLDSDVATRALRILGSLPVNTKSLQAAIRKGGGIKTIASGLNSEEMSEFIEYANSHGDARNGERIYHRNQLMCTTCHAIGGAGGSLGPGLESLGGSAPMDYIVDSLLEPQKKIKEGYHVESLTLKDGGLVSGTLAREDDRQVVVRDMSGAEMTVEKSNIANRTISSVSLMPAGLTASLRKDELADLALFLSQLGKEGDFKVGREPYVRRFRYLDNQGGDSGFADAVRHKPITFALSDDKRLNWMPRYADVDGSLFLNDLPTLRRAGRMNYRYLQFDVEAEKAGRAILRFNDATGVHLLTEEKELEAMSQDFSMPFEAGRQTVTIVVSADERKNPRLGIELLNTDESSIRALAVSGR